GLLAAQIADLEQESVPAAREVVESGDLQLGAEGLSAAPAQARPLRQRRFAQRPARELRDDPLEVGRVLEQRFETLADTFPGLPPEERLGRRADVADVPAGIRDEDDRVLRHLQDFLDETQAPLDLERL